MKIKFGCIYKRKKDCSFYISNEFHYNYYIPVCYKGKYRMIDTYIVNSPSSIYYMNSLEGRLNFLLEANEGETSYHIYNSPDEYYYKNYYDLKDDELEEEYWGEYMNLEDVNILPYYDYRYSLNEYKPSDLYEDVPLWHEDSYNYLESQYGYRNSFNLRDSYGLTYIKKEASKDFKLSLDKKLDETNILYNSIFNLLYKLEETVTELKRAYNNFIDEKENYLSSKKDESDNELLNSTKETYNKCITLLEASKNFKNNFFLKSK